MVRKKKSVLLLMAMAFCICVGACGNSNTQEADTSERMDKYHTETDTQNAVEEVAEQWSKGYNLPVDEAERAEAQKDCKEVMELYFDIYKNADKGEESNPILINEVVFKIQNRIQESGYPVTTIVTYSNMGNYEKVEQFIEECKKGKSGSVVVYHVYNDGNIGRIKFIFDGVDMFVLNAKSVWKNGNQTEMTYISYTRIKEWNYTDKGWFCYEMCVPQPPEVTEIVEGSCMIRIKPMTQEQREMSETCVRDLGYQGNNILSSNWNIDHMEELDYNGLFEYLYRMKYQGKFPFENYVNGIPKEEFESLIMEYFPITAEQIQEYAAFDEENQTYFWTQLGCFNYYPTVFGTSLPEVVAIKEKENGIVILTVEAVCGMITSNDAVITHELTVRFDEDGSFQYLGNEILNDGINSIPDYQYRICVE